MAEIYHMCLVTDYEKALEVGTYLPPTYEADGFIHATENPAMLLDAGTHFYKKTVGAWTCMKIDVAKLAAKVIYEAPMAVGNIEAKNYVTDDKPEEPKFPHIYGPINTDSIIELFPIVRAEDGSFLSITGLC